MPASVSLVKHSGLSCADAHRNPLRDTRSVVRSLTPTMPANITDATTVAGLNAIDSCLEIESRDSASSLPKRRDSLHFKNVCVKL